MCSFYILFVKYLQQISQYFTMDKQKQPDQTDTFQLEPLGVESITSSGITRVISYSLSFSRQRIVINTEFGILLFLNQKTFTRHQKKESPFYISDTEKCGVQLSAILDTRTQIALVPVAGMKKFFVNHVYIYDYQVKTILYCNDFFLTIKQLSFTNKQLIVSNKKRILIYGYINDTIEKDQEYYLKQYTSTEENKSIKYLQTFCQSKEEQQCRCGEFVMNAIEPFKLVYLKISSINKIKHKMLMVYDWQLEKSYQFQILQDQQPFAFTISPDGKYIFFSEDYGRKGKVYLLKQNKLHCLVYLGRNISPVVNHGFFRAHNSYWYMSVRKKQNSSATIHIFNIDQSSVVEYIESKYTRYINLFEQTFKDYNVADHVIGPDYFLKDDVIHSFSLCGIVYDIIDFKRSYHVPKAPAHNFLTWTQQGIM